MKSFLISALAVLAGVQLVAAGQTTKSGVEEPSATPVIGAIVVQGCYSSVGELTFNQNITFNTRDACGQVCAAAGFAVGASSQKVECFCGNKYPAKSQLVSDDQCDNPCPGWGWDACGGFDTFTVYNTGLKIVIDSSGEDTVKTTAAPSASSASQSTVAVTVSDHVVYITQTNAATSGASSGGGGGVNAGAVAGGVVVGVVAIVGIIGGFFFFMRRRRNQEIEEEHRRTAAINSFMGSSKPGSSGGLSSSDSRLDPVMAQRRLSDGSIADNQDYSRKILRVTNA